LLAIDNLFYNHKEIKKIDSFKSIHVDCLDYGFF